MRYSYHRFDGKSATVYFLERGEKVKRHKHPGEHSTGVAVGRARVTVDGSTPLEMAPGDEDFILPANLHHEIEALVDGTIVVNISNVGNNARGGILMIDGTIEYPDV
jgi:quercetin dioxygenase-like cupin family protein